MKKIKLKRYLKKIYIIKVKQLIRIKINIKIDNWLYQE